jgi:hypothetical protein
MKTEAGIFLKKNGHFYTPKLQGRKVAISAQLFVR